MNRVGKLHSAALGALILCLAGVNAAEARQVAAPDASSSAPEDDAIRLQDIEVVNRSVRDAVTDFVERSIAPPRGSGAATWRQPFCIGVGNLNPQMAQALIDRISLAAADLDLALGRPGCEPRVFIAFAADGDAMARQIVASRRNDMRIGLSGSDLGEQALDAFQTSDLPVRWWHVSLPVNPDTGRQAARPRGFLFDAPIGGITRPSDLGPLGITGLPSRLISRTRDDLAQVIIVVDIDKVSGVGLDQLADYLAMVSLAQINPNGGAGPDDSILNLFEPGSAPQALTRWDKAFLAGLYSAEQNRPAASQKIGAVVSAMTRDVEGQRSTATEE